MKKNEYTKLLARTNQQQLWDIYFDWNFCIDGRVGHDKKTDWPREKTCLLINLDAAKEIKGCSINGDLEQLLDETHDKRHQLQQHLTEYQNLHLQLEDATQTAGKQNILGYERLWGIH